MIDVLNECGALVEERQFIRLAEFVLRQLRIHPQANLSIILVDEAAMTRYHERYMNLAGPTDVMSFPMDELRTPDPDMLPPRGNLGDVVLCPEYVAKQAPVNGRSTQGELEYLLVHGILHLLGYDHAEPKEKAEMFALNEQLIRDWAKVDR
jgi:probable rRNA maturation factor